MKYDLKHSTDPLTPFNYTLSIAIDGAETLKLKLLGTMDETIVSKIEEVVATLPKALFQKWHHPTKLQYSYRIRIDLVINEAPVGHGYIATKLEDDFTDSNKKYQNIEPLTKVDSLYHAFNLTYYKGNPYV